MLQSIAIILLSISMSSVAHVVLRKGMVASAPKLTLAPDLFDKILIVGLNPWVIFGMACHVGALIVWLWALSRVEISFAYPFIALGYVLVALMAYFWLGEQISSTKMFGMGFIIVGLIVLSRA